MLAQHLDVFFANLFSSALVHIAGVCLVAAIAIATLIGEVAVITICAGQHKCHIIGTVLTDVATGAGEHLTREDRKGNIAGRKHIDVNCLGLGTGGALNDTTALIDALKAFLPGLCVGSIVTLLLDGDSGEILNADKVSVAGNTSGIQTLKRASTEEEKWYNLNGQRVKSPVKGVYVKDGKKVLVK